MKIISFLFLVFLLPRLSAQEPSAPAAPFSLLLPALQRSLTWQPGDPVISLSGEAFAPLEIELPAAPDLLWLSNDSVAGIFDSGLTAGRLRWQPEAQNFVIEAWLHAPDGDSFLPTIHAPNVAPSDPPPWPPDLRSSRSSRSSRSAPNLPAGPSSKNRQAKSFRQGAPVLPLSPTAANLFIFPLNPFTNPDTLMTSASRQNDWTSPGAFFNTVIPYLNQGPTAGLVPQPELTLPLSGINTVRLTNQIAPNITYITTRAVASIPSQGQIGWPLGAIRFSPPAGTYQLPPLVNNPASTTTSPLPSLRLLPVRLILNTSDTVSWRFLDQALGPLQPYTPGQSILVADGQTITTFLNGLPSSTSEYHFIAATAALTSSSPDADLDGMPDAWELIFNLTSPTADADGDGLTNLAEYRANTDPTDPSSNPAQPITPPILLTLHPTTRRAQLNWAARPRPMLLNRSSNLSVWNGTVILPNQTSFNEGAAPRMFYRLLPQPTVQE